MVSASACPFFPFSRTTDIQPAPEYAELREKSPISQVELWDSTHPFLIVKHNDITKVLVDERLSKERSRPGFPEMSAGGKEAAKNKPTFVDMDAPDHMNQRGMVESLFSPEAVEKLRPHIQKTADDLLDAFIKKGGKEPIDIVANYALPLPSYIIYGILGVPFSDLEYLTEQNAIRSNGSATSSEASNANQELLNYLHKLVELRTEEPKDDLISKLVVEQLRPGNIDIPTAVQIAFLLLVAGNATMVTMIILGMITLLQHPDQLEEFQKNKKKLIGPFVKELCRYHQGSAMATRRVAKVDVEYDGKLIPAGTGIIAACQSGNRDKEIFGPTADEFDIHRFLPKSEGGLGAQEVDSLGFGFGPHRCIAEHLALAELEIAIETLFTRLPNINLAVPFEKLHYSKPTKDIGFEGPILVTF